MPHHLIAIFAVFAFLFGPATGRADAAEQTEPLVLVTEKGRFEFTVEMATPPRQQRLGLMYRKEMDADHGMLFDFGRPREAGFWMKNTLISLDMVFISANGRVHRIAAATTPLSEEVIPSQGAVRAVLELVAGTARRIGLKPGDRVEHRIFSNR